VAGRCLSNLEQTYGLGASGRSAMPLFGRGASGNIAIPLLGLGASGSIAIPLFGRGASGSIAIPLRLPPANDIAKFVAAIAKTVNNKERNRLFRVDIANPPLLWVEEANYRSTTN
jgi:hypothetical protein